MSSPNPLAVAALLGFPRMALLALTAVLEGTPFAEVARAAGCSRSYLSKGTRWLRDREVVAAARRGAYTLREVRTWKVDGLDRALGLTRGSTPWANGPAVVSTPGVNGPRVTLTPWVDTPPSAVLTPEVNTQSALLTPGVHTQSALLTPWRTSSGAACLRVHVSPEGVDYQGFTRSGRGWADVDLRGFTPGQQAGGRVDSQGSTPRARVGGEFQRNPDPEEKGSAEGRRRTGVGDREKGKASSPAPGADRRSEALARFARGRHYPMGPWGDGGENAEAAVAECLEAARALHGPVLVEDRVREQLARYPASWVLAALRLALHAKANGQVRDEWTGYWIKTLQNARSSRQAPRMPDEPRAKPKEPPKPRTHYPEYGEIDPALYPRRWPDGTFRYRDGRLAPDPKKGECTDLILANGWEQQKWLKKVCEENGIPY